MGCELHWIKASSSESLSSPAFSLAATCSASGNLEGSTTWRPYPLLHRIKVSPTMHGAPAVQQRTHTLVDDARAASSRTENLVVSPPHRNMAAVTNTHRGSGFCGCRPVDDALKRMGLSKASIVAQQTHGWCHLAGISAVSRPSAGQQNVRIAHKLQGYCQHPLSAYRRIRACSLQQEPCEGRHLAGWLGMVTSTRAGCRSWPVAVECGDWRRAPSNEATGLCAEPQRLLAACGHGRVGARPQQRATACRMRTPVHVSRGARARCVGTRCSWAVRWRSWTWPLLHRVVFSCGTKPSKRIVAAARTMMEYG
jgi:hypothetical protein